MTVGASALPPTRPDRGVPGPSAPRELYRLRADAKLVSAADGAIVLRQPLIDTVIAAPRPGGRALLERMAEQWTDEAEVRRVLTAAEGERGVLAGQLLLRRLRQLWLSTRLQAGGRPLVDIIPVALGAGTAPRPARSAAGVRYRMSRFAALSADAGLLASAPFAPAAVAIPDARIAGALVPAATAGCTGEELAHIADLEPGAATAVLDALLTARILVSCADRQAESREPPWAVWSPHELALHHRARAGWHALPNGGTYRFRGQFPAEPIERPPEPTGPATAQDLPVPDLPVPDLERISAVEGSLTEVITKRRSVRHYDEDNPITVGQLSEFLYRVQRSWDLTETADGQGTGRRPYPAGGALCELEIYPLVSRCAGLAAGLYRYDSVAHRLIRLAALDDAALTGTLPDKERPDTAQAPNDAGRRMLGHARDAARMTATPQVLLVITARAQRVLWKYEGMGYALALKNAGVLTGLMYLVATAMGLAPCALGSGDSAAFAALSGLDPLVEPDIADFALGARRTSAGCEIREPRPDPKVP